MVAEAVAQACGGSAADDTIDAETDLFEAGLSSLTSAKLRSELQKAP